MSESKTAVRSIGTFTVLDIMLFVAACSMSILLIRILRPPAANWWDYVELTTYCGPAGVSVFGPWAVRRQFLESSREELWPGEWLWIMLGASWLGATPIAFVMGGAGVHFFSALLAIAIMLPALVALFQTLTSSGRKPWTHWAGIGLSLLHAAPALLQTGPTVWHFLDEVVEFFERSGIF